MFRTGLLLCIALLAVSGCDQKQAEATEQMVIYENEEVGLKIYESSNWILDSEVSTEPFNATFKEDHVRAIVSVVPGVRTLDQIKNELNLTRDFVQIIEESEQRLSFQMNEQERLRSDIYTGQSNDETLIITFLTPVEQYEANHEKIEEFRKNIKLLH